MRISQEAGSVQPFFWPFLSCQLQLHNLTESCLAGEQLIPTSAVSRTQAPKPQSSSCYLQQARNI